MTEATLKEKLTVKDKWIRLLFMILFVIINWLAKCIVYLIAAIQFIYSLFVGTPYKALLPFSASLSKYIYQIVAFLTYSSEEKPFPFSSWPKETTKEEKKKVEK